MDFDLDAITGKKRYIKYLGRKVEIKDLTVKEYLNTEALLSNLDMSDSTDPAEYVENISTKIVQYTMSTMDISKNEAEKMTFKQFRALREYLSELELLEQGFSKKEAHKMLSDAAKKQINQTVGL